MKFIRNENTIFTVLKYFFLRAIGSKKEIVIKLENVKLFIRPSSTDLKVAVNSLARKEFKNLKVNILELRSNLIVDGGGYIGTAAIALSKLFPESTIISIEPSKDNFRILKKNVSSFPNIIPINKALVHRDASNIRLFNRGAEWGYTTIDHPEDNKNPEFMDTVEGVSITSLLNIYRKEGIDILKLDIEGAEKQLLENSSEWIGKVGILLVELHDRIVKGCSISFYQATSGMRDLDIDKEKVVAINDSYFKKIETKKA